MGSMLDRNADLQAGKDNEVYMTISFGWRSNGDGVVIFILTIVLTLGKGPVKPDRKHNYNTCYTEDHSYSSCLFQLHNSSVVTCRIPSGEGIG